jgi:hypothetical protein
MGSMRRARGSFCQCQRVGEVARGITVSRMSRDQALALGEWDNARQNRISLGPLAEMPGVGGRGVLDRAMRNAGCAPLLGDHHAGRIPAGETIRMRRMCARVEKRDPSVHEAMGKPNGMVVSSEMVREDVATLRFGMERGQAERYSIGAGADSPAGSVVDVEGVMTWACEFEQWGFGVRRRERAKRALDQAREAMREITAAVRSLRARLEERDARLAELTEAWERWQVREAGVQPFRERLACLIAHYERELNGSGPMPYPEPVKVGFCFISRGARSRTRLFGISAGLRWPRSSSRRLPCRPWAA